MYPQKQTQGGSNAVRANHLNVALTIFRHTAELGSEDDNRYGALESSPFHKRYPEYLSTTWQGAAVISIDRQLGCKGDLPFA
jgi:hypothetical protein